MRTLIVVPIADVINEALALFEARIDPVHVATPKSELEGALLVWGTSKDVRKRLPHIGTFDAILIYDCFNMSRIHGTATWGKVETELKARNPAVLVRGWRSQAPAALAGAAQAPAPAQWTCGDLRAALPARCALPGLSIPGAGFGGRAIGPGCGAANEESHMFCRNCGNFRGVIKK